LGPWNDASGASQPVEVAAETTYELKTKGDAQMDNGTKLKLAVVTALAGQALVQNTAKATDWCTLQHAGCTPVICDGTHYLWHAWYACPDGNTIHDWSCDCGWPGC